MDFRNSLNAGIQAAKKARANKEEILSNQGFKRKHIQF
jgi:hypothetical protein